MIGSFVLGCVAANNLEYLQNGANALIQPVVQEKDLEYRMSEWFRVYGGIQSLQELLSAEVLVSEVPSLTTFGDKKIKVRSKDICYVGLYTQILTFRCYDHSNAEQSARALINMMPEQEEYEIDLSYTRPFVLFRAGADIISYLPSANKTQADYLAKLGSLAIKSDLGTCFTFNQRIFNV